MKYYWYIMGHWNRLHASKSLFDVESTGFETTICNQTISIHTKKPVNTKNYSDLLMCRNCLRAIEFELPKEVKGY